MAKRNKIRYTLDIKDMWPTHLVEAFPYMLQPIAKLIFAPYYAITKRTIINAHLTGNCQECIEWEEK